VSRSVIHANGENGRTLCNRWKLAEVIHLVVFRQRPKAGEMLGERVTCRICLRMMRWEYKIVGNPDLESLNELGADRWEAFYVGLANYEVWFKRPLEYEPAVPEHRGPARFTDTRSDLQCAESIPHHPHDWISYPDAYSQVLVHCQGVDKRAT
jgi:hypothetical protein